MTTFSPSLDYAKQLDSQDPLASYREQFVITNPDLIYLDGNSLGMMPKVAQEKSRQIVDEQWGVDLIRGWNKGWWEAPACVGDKVGQLIGAVAQADQFKRFHHPIYMVGNIGENGENDLRQEIECFDNFDFHFDHSLSHCSLIPLFFILPDLKGLEGEHPSNTLPFVDIRFGGRWDVLWEGLTGSATSCWRSPFIHLTLTGLSLEVTG